VDSRAVQRACGRHHRHLRRLPLATRQRGRPKETSLSGKAAANACFGSSIASYLQVNAGDRISLHCWATHSGSAKQVLTAHWKSFFEGMHVVL
jgi:hypothetical protein